MLVALRGNLVTHAELSARVWPGMIVESNTVHVHALGLAQALGDGNEGPRYIVTTAGRGYRFVGEIGQASLPSPGPALDRRPAVPELQR